MGSKVGTGHGRLVMISIAMVFLTVAILALVSDNALGDTIFTEPVIVSDGEVKRMANETVMFNQPVTVNGTFILENTTLFSNVYGYSSSFTIGPNGSLMIRNSTITHLTGYYFNYIQIRMSGSGWLTIEDTEILTMVYFVGDDDNNSARVFLNNVSKSEEQNKFYLFNIDLTLRNSILNNISLFIRNSQANIRDTTISQGGSSSSAINCENSQLELINVRLLDGQEWGLTGLDSDIHQTNVTYQLNATTGRNGVGKYRIATTLRFDLSDEDLLISHLIASRDGDGREEKQNIESGSDGFTMELVTEIEDYTERWQPFPYTLNLSHQYGGSLFKATVPGSTIVLDEIPTVPIDIAVPGLAEDLEFKDISRSKTIVEGEKTEVKFDIVNQGVNRYENLEIMILDGYRTLDSIIIDLEPLENRSYSLNITLEPGLRTVELVAGADLAFFELDPPTRELSFTVKSYEESYRDDESLSFGAFVTILMVVNFGILAGAIYLIRRFLQTGTGSEWLNRDGVDVDRNDGFLEGLKKKK